MVARLTKTVKMLALLGNMTMLEHEHKGRDKKTAKKWTDKLMTFTVNGKNWLN